MKGLLKTVILMATFCATAMACGGGEDVLEQKGGEGGGTGNKGDKEEPEQPFVAHITPIDKLNQGAPVINSHADVTSRSSLKMNFRTYSQLGESVLKSAKPNYIRIKKLANGGYIMFYHNNQIGASCSYATSTDFKTWNYKGKVFTNYSITDSKGEKNDRRYSNCDGVVLSNGEILAVASYRANNGYRDLPKDAGIEMRRSMDNGVTWSEPVSVYQGVNWEPYLLELSSGEIHCYFTDSSRTGIESKDTGTAMVISRDGGQTWTPSFGSTPYYVIRMKWEQDGKTYFNHQMPSVIQLKGSNELAAAVETNNRGTYYISLAYSGEDGEWEHLDAYQEGPTDSNNLAFQGSAPYLSQFPSGETVLSYNKSSTFYMKMGDAKARNFGSAYSPFSGKGYWGTLNLNNSHQLVGAMPDTSKGTIMLSQFILNHRIDAIHRSVKVDGNNKEWANTDHALFVGEKSQAQGTLRCSCDEDNIYFLLEVLDRNVLASDYVSLYLSSADNNKLAKGDCRIQVTMNGLKSCETYDTSWRESQWKAQVKTYVCNDTNEREVDNYGYIAEIAVPRSELPIISSGQALVNFSITKHNSEESLCDVSSSSTACWIPIKGL